MTFFLPSPLTKVMGQNRSINEDEDNNYNNMDKHKTSKVMLYFRESEFPMHRFIQMNVHYVIHDKGARKKKFYLLMKCKNIYISIQKTYNHLINNHNFIDVEYSGK